MPQGVGIVTIYFVTFVSCEKGLCTSWCFWV